MRAYSIVIFMVWCLAILAGSIVFFLSYHQKSFKTAALSWMSFPLSFLFIVCASNISIWRKVQKRNIALLQQNRATRENDENGVEAEGTQEGDNDTENDSQETESSSPETSTTFHSKRPCEHCENSNVYRILIMKCPKCFWHDYYKIFSICDHQIPEGRNYMKEGFFRCHDCGAVTHKNAKTLETNFYSPSTEENEDED